MKIHKTQSIYWVMSFSRTDRIKSKAVNEEWIVSFIEWMNLQWINHWSFILVLVQYIYYFWPMKISVSTEPSFLFFYYQYKKSLSRGLFSSFHAKKKTFVRSQSVSQSHLLLHLIMPTSLTSTQINIKSITNVSVI